MLPNTVTTERLVLRPWTFADLDDVLAMATDPEWGRYLPLPNPYLRADGARFIAAQILLDPNQHHTWAVEHEGCVRGGINVRLYEMGRIGEIGYSIARPLWGRGLGTEAVRQVVATVFKQLTRLQRLRAMADARNVASIRVLEKSGFAREGVLRANRFHRDEPVDEVWFGLLRAEWQP
jgi:[ribosomal protein S5]-alanine N-acetyltransferase